ncbi:MAG: VanZ family protein, partial [Anaerovoracaceae bacterium]
MRKTKKVLLVLACLMLAFIWGHSLMSVEQSGAESLRVVELLKSLVSRVCGLLGIGGAVEVVWITDHLVRKTAHFVEFAVMGGLFGLVMGAGSEKPGE